MSFLLDKCLLTQQVNVEISYQLELVQKFHPKHDELKSSEYLHNVMQLNFFWKFFFKENILRWDIHIFAAK